MKLFGYLDDLLNWIINFHLNLGWWLLIIIPVEIFLIWCLIRFFNIMNREFKPL